MAMPSSAAHQSNPNMMSNTGTGPNGSSSSAVAAAAAMMNACIGNGLSVGNERNNAIQLSLNRQQSLNLQHNLQQLLLDLKQQTGGNGIGANNNDGGAGMSLPPPPPPPGSSGRMIGAVSSANNPLIAGGLLTSTESNGDFQPVDYNSTFVRTGYDEYDDEQR
jgi:hypothetical protein